MKKAMYAISILSSLLILVMIILVMTKQEQYEMRQTIDNTYKESFLRILDSMRQMEDPAFSVEEKQMLSARDTAYGFNLRTLQFSTSYAKQENFCTISLLLDEATGTDAIYTLAYSDELYDTLIQLYDKDFQDVELLKKARVMLEAAID